MPTPKHRTDYAGHDRRYREQRARGFQGWDEPESAAAVAAQLLGLLASPHCPPSGRALEIGCGAGDTALLLARLGYRVTGVDVAPFAVSWAREKAEAEGLTVDLRTLDVRELDSLDAASFDLVVDGHCLHCIIGDDRAVVLSGIRRLLAPGGRLLVRTMCGEVADEELGRQVDPETRCQVVDGVAYRYFGTAEAILEELVAAGFALLSHEVTEEPDEPVRGYLTAWLAPR